SLVVADEPTSMLDVSSRTGIMTLMQELAEGLGVAYLYITHDLAVARYMCHRIAVMYLGKIVEMADTEELLRNPLHPYTKALLSAVPVPDPDHHRERPNISGEVTEPIDPPSRCRFFDRCPEATEFCRDNPHPPLEEKASGHFAACHVV
ncbi:MAG: ABC transporter ATP-binding protein, partial [Chloroflexi bacterium]|nr:ABC transporter ATP-binding protein [Chloroflexota bacterium]